MGTTYKFNAHSVTDQHTDEPTINYSTSQTGTSQYKNVNGKESVSTGGVTRATARSKEAGVMYHGISISPDEIDSFIEEVEGEKAEAEAEAEQAEQEPEPEGFSNSTNMILDDLDAGDLANAINQAVDGNLTDENIINAVKSLGFSDKESALEVGSNLVDSFKEYFGNIAATQGIDPETSWDALLTWNKAEARKAIHDWVNARGVDSSRLQAALDESLNKYGRYENQGLIEVLQESGYEVRKSPAGGLIIRGNNYKDWTTWTEFRKQYKKQ
jgi:hypothetical protein